MARVRLAFVVFAAAAGLCACSAPQRPWHARSPLLKVDSGPLTPESRPAGTAEPADPTDLSTPAAAHVEGERIAETARSFLGRRKIVASGKKFTDDCSGLVRAVYAQHGVELYSEFAKGDNGVTAIYRYARRHGSVRRSQPRAGDIVFFRQTYDRNRDGRRNDGLTHVGIVESIGNDGTVQVIHRVARGVVRYRMNLEKPNVRVDRETGRVLNDFIAEGGKARLAGELFDGYATVVAD